MRRAAVRSRSLFCKFVEDGEACPSPLGSAKRGVAARFKCAAPADGHRLLLTRQEPLGVAFGARDDLLFIVKDRDSCLRKQVRVALVRELELEFQVLIRGWRG